LSLESSLPPQHRLALSYACSFSTFPFFFDAPATPDTYTLSLHDALPISRSQSCPPFCAIFGSAPATLIVGVLPEPASTSNVNMRSEEHTSELQSRENLVCRLLLEKKKKKASGNKHSKGRSDG